MGKRISHETIYAAIYFVPRGELRRSLIGCLRQQRKVRRPRHRSGLKRGDIPNPTPIAARPLEVEARLVPGHWEGDIMKGRANGSAVGTLVERSTRLMLLARMPGLDSLSVVKGFARKLGGIPQRGSNENTNGLLRQFLPKNTDLSVLTQRELNVIATRLNNRPRQTLNWMTPNEAWNDQVKNLVALGT